MCNTKIIELQGRGNSRIHRIDTENGKAFVLKTYPDRLMDSRNRIETEFNAFKFLKKNNINNVPTPLKADKNFNIGVYQYRI